MSTVIIFTKDETKNTLHNDADHYVRSLSEYDLCARKHDSSKLYLIDIMNAALSLSDDQSNLLKSLCTYVDNHILQQTSNSLFVKLIDPIILARIKWKLAFTKGKSYENGFPHTRMDIIFMSDAFFESDWITQASTLLHEKIHVYQRLNKGTFRQALKRFGYIPSIKRVNLYKLRANPDVDEWIYAAPNGDLLGAVYSNDRPKSISDIIYLSNSHDEHPFEYVAYLLARTIK